MLKTEDEQREIILIVDRIDKLRIAQGLSINALAMKSGISANTFQYIYKRKSFPNIQTILNICDVFEISLGEFFLYDDSQNNLSIDEIEFIKLFQDISFSSKKALLEIMKVLK